MDLLSPVNTPAAMVNRQYVDTAIQNIQMGGGSHNYLITPADWNVDTKTCRIVDPNIIAGSMDFGLPTPTTRLNANAVASSNIIVVEIGAGYVVLNADTLPSIDIIISLRY